MRKVFLLVAIFATIIACKKDKVKTLTPKEQSKADDEQIVEYMKSSKFKDFFVGDMENNIDWLIVPIDDNDDENTETLFDLMENNVITTNYNGVDYKMYYFIKDVGTGDVVTKTDSIYVDYNVFSLYTSDTSERIDFSNLSAVKFDISGLIEGWQLGMEKFNLGTKPTEFPGTSSAPYRELTENPGRGVLLVPSGLAYGPGSGVLRFDIVTYLKDVIER